MHYTKLPRCLPLPTLLAEGLINFSARIIYLPLCPPEWQSTYPDSRLTARQLVAAYEALITKAGSSGAAVVSDGGATRRPGRKRKHSGNHPPLLQETEMKVNVFHAACETSLLLVFLESWLPSRFCCFLIFYCSLFSFLFPVFTFNFLQFSFSC